MSWRGMVRPGMARRRYGKSRFGVARLGAAGQGGGRAWQGEARRGATGQGGGGAWRGMAGLGEARQGGGTSRQGAVGHGAARLGWARQGVGVAWSGVAWQGRAQRGEEEACVRPGGERPGRARQDKEAARRCGARRGGARQGKEKARKQQTRSSYMDEETKVERFPFDTAILQPGTILTEEWCRNHLPGKVHTGHTFRMLALKKQIEEETRNAGAPVVARIFKCNQIKILPHDEGDQYIQDRCVSHLHSYAKDTVRRLHQVQVDKLSPEQKAKRDRDIAIHAMKLQAMRGADRVTVQKAICAS